MSSKTITTQPKINHKETERAMQFTQHTASMTQAGEKVLESRITAAATEAINQVKKRIHGFNESKHDAERKRILKALGKEMKVYVASRTEIKNFIKAFNALTNAGGVFESIFSMDQLYKHASDLLQGLRVENLNVSLIGSGNDRDSSSEVYEGRMMFLGRADHVDNGGGNLVMVRNQAYTSWEFLEIPNRYKPSLPLVDSMEAWRARQKQLDELKHELEQAETKLKNVKAAVNSMKAQLNAQLMASDPTGVGNIVLAKVDQSVNAFMASDEEFNQLLLR